MENKEKEAQEKEPFSLKKEILSWIWIIVVAAAIAFFLNTFIIANSRVPSGSMENTIMTGDRVIGSRLSYRLHDPERGDIAIFHFPDDPTGKTLYVKRVIGLPGETVDIENGQVFIDGEALDEPYIREPMIPEEPMHFEVPKGCYFMMGDNRNYSSDARYWRNHYVEKDQIIAKVLFRYFPFTEIAWLDE